MAKLSRRVFQLVWTAQNHATTSLKEISRFRRAAGPEKSLQLERRGGDVEKISADQIRSNRHRFISPWSGSETVRSDGPWDVSASPRQRQESASACLRRGQSGG